MLFTGKTVVITGAGSGIGTTTAALFAERGARVVIADINAAAARKVAEGIAGSIAVEVDVRARESVRELLSTANREIGPVDVLINNAMTCSPAPFLSLTDEEIARDIGVNLVGAIYTSQEVLPQMLDRHSGLILNVSSVNGLAFFGNDAYSAAKAGLMSLTRSIANQFGSQGVRCNAVAPGTIAPDGWQRGPAAEVELFDRAADWYPLGRVGTRTDIAEALSFLASPAADWITGIVLPIEGGLLTGNLPLARNLMPQLRTSADE
jgi:meso-butanediol dehydrogenase/(S,S)-butanediol dehydrogenase/diacetyl reductase